MHFYLIVLFLLVAILMVFCEVSCSSYYYISSISHGVENYFPGVWGTGISDAIFKLLKIKDKKYFFHFLLFFLVKVAK